VSEGDIPTQDEGSSEPYENPSFVEYTSKSEDKGHKEAIIVSILFLGVIGLSIGMATMDDPETELAEVMDTPEVTVTASTEEDLDVVLWAETLKTAAATSPDELLDMGVDDLIEAPSPYDEEDEESGDPMEDQKPPAPIKRDKLYVDLVVYDVDNPVILNGEPVNVPTPPNPMANAPPPQPKRSRPKAAPEQEQAADAEPTEPEQSPPAQDSPADVPGLMSDASRKLKTGDPRGAAEDYKRVLAQKPGYTKARVDLAQAYYEMNQTGQAQDALKGALKANPNHAKALLLMASIAQGQGNGSNAKKFYQRFVDNHPTSPKVQAVQSILNRL